MTDHALVLFSGGQDSTTCLAWALDRYPHVETVGFAYGQRHAVELDCRAPIRGALAALWPGRLGPDHMIDLAATLAGLGATALTSDTAIAMTDEGLPNTFVPGRNLLFFTCAARAGLPPRPAPHRRRHVRDRLLRLSRLPRRHHQGDAARAQPRHAAPLRAGDAADVARQGGHLGAGRSARRRGAGRADPHRDA